MEENKYQLKREFIKMHWEGVTTSEEQFEWLWSKLFPAKEPTDLTKTEPKALLISFCKYLEKEGGNGFVSPEFLANEFLKSYKVSKQEPISPAKFWALRSRDYDTYMVSQTDRISFRTNDLYRFMEEYAQKK